MKRTWTIIGVRDVHASLRWYQSLFGQPETPPSHDDFGQILDTDGTVFLCLHQWGAHEHPLLDEPGRGVTRQRAVLVLSRGRFRHNTEESTRSRHPVRRGASREPEHPRRTRIRALPRVIWVNPLVPSENTEQRKLAAIMFIDDP